MPVSESELGREVMRILYQEVTSKIEKLELMAICGDRIQNTLAGPDNAPLRFGRISERERE
jgi:hypothetical protein